MRRWDQASRLAITTAAVLSVGPMSAMAQSSRTPAPIIYKMQEVSHGTASARQVPVQQGAGEAASGATTVPSSGIYERPRIEFRHPGQPTPMAANPAVHTPEPARQYARLETPRTAPLMGGFTPVPAPSVSDVQRQTAPTPTRPAADTYSLPGVVHRPAEVTSYDETGLASVYGAEFNGQPTANGEIYDANKLTAAHPSLPRPSLVQVIKVQTGQEVVVRVNDRGPFQEGRMIDLSARAAQSLSISDPARTEIRVRYLGPASIESTPQEPRWIAGTAETPSRPVAEFEVAALSETVAPARQPVVNSHSPVLQATPRPVPVSQGGYYVQVGSFTQIGNAERMSRSVSPGMSVRVIPARVNNADYFRVWVGPYASEYQAEQVRNDIARRGVANGVVVSGR